MTTLFDLHGKTAIITGASSGLGEQFARSLSNAGARVILAARNIEKLSIIESELGNARAIQLDISDKLSIANCFKELEKYGEKIDICVNNAGTSLLTPIFDDSDDSNDKFESIIKTNLIGAWHMTKFVAIHMKNNNIAGSIINIASVNGANKLRPEATAYCASKAGLIQLTKALVGELSAYNIRINAISPGLVHTPLSDYKVNTVEKRKEMENSIPLGFVATPKDLEGALLLLASNKYSAYITGTTITVDGGVSWGGQK